MGALSALPALDIKGVQQPDLLEKYGQLAQLRGLQQQQAEAPLRMQALQQNVQSGGIDLQQKQQALKDQQVISSVLPEWDGNLDSLAMAAAKKGASASAVMGLRQQAMKQKQELASLDETSLKNMAVKNNAVVGALDALKQIPDEQLGSAVVATAQDLIQKGLIDPQHGQMAAQIAQSGDPKAMRQQLDFFQKGLQGHSQQIEEAQKQTQLTEAARHNTALEDQAAATLANTQANQQATRKQEQQRIGIEGARLNFEKAKAGIGSNGQPSDLSAAIAKGQITPERMAYLIARNPEVLQGVLQVDPSFDGSKAASYPAVYKDFTSGKTSVALNAGATALGHLSELKELNTPASHIPGTPAYNAYQNKVDTVASELAKFYGDATIPAIAAIKKTLAANLPGGRDAAIKTQAQSMGDKLDSFQQTWQNAAPSKAYQAPMPGISPKAQAARESLAGQQGAGVSVTAPNGKVYSFKDQQAADNFKKNAGIQ